jgi:hypothetical protein
LQKPKSLLAARGVRRAFSSERRAASSE